MAPAASWRPAGFWQRGAAWSIDTAVIAPGALLLAWPWLAAAGHVWLTQWRTLLQLGGEALGHALVVGAPLPRLVTAVLEAPGLREAIRAAHAATWSLAGPGLLAFAALGGLYHVAGECSRWQGGLGKRVLGLRACDRHGRRLGVGRACLRHLAASLSWATLNLGHLMAAWPPRHLALHDRGSGTVVVASHDRLPHWAWAWLALLALAGLLATAVLAVAGAAILRAALEHAIA